MTTLIEGMAKAMCRASCKADCPCCREDTEGYLPEAEAAFAFLADPQNITPEMVEAGNRAHKEAVNYNASHDCGTRFYRPKDPMKAAISAALTAAGEK